MFPSFLQPVTLFPREGLFPSLPLSALSAQLAPAISAAESAAIARGGARDAYVQQALVLFEHPNLPVPARHEPAHPTLTPGEFLRLKDAQNKKATSLVIRRGRGAYKRDAQKLAIGEGPSSLPSPSLFSTVVWASSLSASARACFTILKLCLGIQNPLDLLRSHLAKGARVEAVLSKRKQPHEFFVDQEGTMGDAEYASELARLTDEQIQYLRQDWIENPALVETRNRLGFANMPNVTCIDFLQRSTAFQVSFALSCSFLPSQFIIFLEFWRKSSPCVVLTWSASLLRAWSLNYPARFSLEVASSSRRCVASSGIMPSIASRSAVSFLCAYPFFVSSLPTFPLLISPGRMPTSHGQRSILLARITKCSQ